MKISSVPTDHPEIESFQMKVSLKSLKYRVIRALSFPVPGLRYDIPIIGGKSSIEIITMVALLIGLTYSASSNYLTAGNVTEGLFSIGILMGLHYFNFLTIIFNISVERAVFWHKACTSLGIICMIIHAVLASFDSATGIILGLTVLAMGALYVLFKDRKFELFYYSHVTGIFLVILFSILHGAVFVAIACCLWVVDVIVRHVLQGKIVQVDAKIASEGIIEMKFKNSFNYEAGQFCFIRVPGVSRLQFHPFSLSSSPHDQDTSFHIEVRGDWTLSCRDLVSSLNNAPLTVHVEGPYGSPEIDIWGHSYKFFVLIAGGIGATPMMSVYGALIHEYKTASRDFKKVHFIWSVRSEGVFASLSPRVASHEEGVKDVFESSIHLTSQRQLSEVHSDKIPSSVRDRLKFGRPHFPTIFRGLVESCRAESIRRVAVMVCGPPTLVAEVDEICRSSRLDCSVDAVHLDCHKEVFDL